ncbi:MAG: hypothetical protein ABW034_13700 [Steroidobacteraceae bacterium]
MLVATNSISLADELPLEHIPPEKRWSENYCFIGYDFVTRVGLYLHIGRWLQDPTIWREQLYVYLPDGTTLNYRSLGRGDSAKGPHGALVSYDCQEPGHLWRVTFKGPTNHLTRAQVLEAHGLREQPMEIMEMDAIFKGAGPIIRYDVMDNVTFGRWHYEQEMSIDARFKFRGQTYEMKAAQGWRDHTRGPRHLADVRGHINFQGRLPDGRFFCAFQVWEERNAREVQIVNDARLVNGSDFIEAEILEATRLRSVSALDNDIKLTLKVGKEHIELVGRPLNLMCYSCTPTFEILYGFAPEAAPFVCFNQPVQFRFGNQVIGGSIERTMWFGPTTLEPNAM